MALFGLAGAGYYVFRTNLDSLQRLNKETLGWSVNQLQLELHRLTGALTELYIDRRGVTVQDVNNRYDILWSRMVLAEQGTIGARMRAHDGEAQTLTNLGQVVRGAEAQITSLSADDKDAILALVDAFRAMEAPMAEFSRKAFQGEELQIAAARNNLQQSSLFTATVTLLAFVTAAVTLFLVNRESGKNRIMAASNYELLQNAQRAHQTKTRFLNMMSHELRTPMNGVLGMLSLVKQPGLAAPQLRLVEQAERSGRQMISMLSDILDYSAIQDRRMELSRKPFEPRQLAKAIEELFDSVARREGINLSISCADGCPMRLEGDVRRLRQIIAHFSSYIIETAGTRNVDISLSYENEALMVRISFDYGSDAGQDISWKPEILLGHRDESAEQFASDALGPAVARGILQRMGGRVWLDYPDDDRISIILSAPTRVVALDELCVHIDAKSESLKMICRVSLSGEKVVFHEPGSPDPVHVVLIETGGSDEMERLRSIEEQFPNAMLVALGDPVNPSDFDDQVSIPLEIGSLRETIVTPMTASR